MAQNTLKQSDPFMYGNALQEYVDGKPVRYNRNSDPSVYVPQYGHVNENEIIPFELEDDE